MNVGAGAGAGAKGDGTRGTEGSVQVIARAAAILRRLATAPQGRSLAELAAEVGLPRSTVHRLIKALESEGLVAPVSASGGFRLGPGLLQIASANRGWLVAQVHPELVTLSDRLKETVDLAVLSGDHVVFIDQVARPQRLQTMSAVGVAFPLHSTANGKALLATLDEAEIRKLLPSRLRRLTCHTITSLDVLLTELQEVRATGLAWDREENDIGICAVGTTISSGVGILTAVSVPVPASRFTGREDALGRSLLAACRRMERTLAG
jgi:DNA-binding IclR family transcriptional regulator